MESGAAIKFPQESNNTLEAVVRAVEVPVNLKTRTGWSPATRNALRIAEIAQGSGIAALRVHGGSATCGYDRPAEHETVRLLREPIQIPIIANGDIDSPESARRVPNHIRADGLMIGRTTLGRSWIFAEIRAALGPANGKGQAACLDLASCLIEHLESIHRLYGEERGVRIARKQLSWYCQRLGGEQGLGPRIKRSTSAREQPELVHAILASQRLQGHPP